MAAAVALLALILVWPIKVTTDGKQYDCGTFGSSFLNERQFTSRYGEAPGSDCEHALSRQFALGGGVIVAGMGAIAALRIIDQRRRPYVQIQSA